MPRKVVQWMYYISTSNKFLGGRLFKFNLVPHEFGSSVVSRTCSADKTEKVASHTQFSELIRHFAARVWRTALVPALLLSLLAAPPVALAQTEPSSMDMVSNIDQTSDVAGYSTATYSYSTSFATGGNTRGYMLTGVKWKVNVGDSGTGVPDYTISIFSDLSGDPGTKLHTLTNPSSLSTGTATLSSSNSGGYALTANTTYHFVFEGEGTLSDLSLLVTDSGDEDATPVSGWSIGTGIRSKANADSDWSDTDNTRIRSLQFAIVGYTVTTPPTASILPGTQLNAVNGQVLLLTGLGEDPDGDTITYSWDVSAADSGTDTTNILIADPNDTSTASFSTLVVDTYTVTLTVTDEYGATGTDTATIVVRENTNPTASIDVPTGPVDVLSGAPLQMRGSGTESDPGDFIDVDGFLWSVLPDTATVTADVNDSSMATFASSTAGTYTVTLTAVDQGSGEGTDTLTVTVKDTLPPEVTISPSGDQSADLDTDLVLTATAAEPGEPDAVLTYSWSASDSSGNDVTSDVLSGTSTATATFNASEEDDYTVTLTVSDNDTPTPETATVTLTVTIAQQRLVLSTKEITVNEAGGTDSWTVKLNTQPTGPVTVVISSDDSTVATVSPMRLNFSTSNWDTAQTVMVRGEDDTDTNEPFRMAMISHTASGADYSAAPVASVTVTAKDDDIPGLKLSRTAISVVESAGTGSWMVELNTQPTGPVTVNVSPGTSGSGVEMVSPMSLSFDATNWSTPQTVEVTVVNDEIDNADRTATITHSATGANYEGLSGAVALTVVDDDTAGFMISKTALTILKGGRDSYTVHLTSEPTGTVIVVATPGTPSGPQNVEQSPVTLTFSSSNWSTPQAVELSVRQNSLVEADTTLFVRHAVTGTDSGYASVSLGQVTVTIPGLAVGEDGGVTFMVQNGMVNVPTGQSELSDIEGIQLSFKAGMLPMSNVKIVPREQSGVPDGGPSGFSTDGEGNVAAVDISLANEMPYRGEVTICLPRVEEGGRVYRWEPGNDMMPEGWMVLPLPEGDIPDGYACGVANEFSLFAAGAAPSGKVAKARLAQLGRVMAGQVVDAVKNRLSASRDAGFKATMAGQALPSFGDSSNVPAYANTPRYEQGSATSALRDWQHTQVRELSTQSLLSGSTFSLTDKDQSAGSVAVWGQASINGFEGDGVDDGQMTSGFFGADWASDRLTAGLALSHSSGEGKWTSDNRDLEFESTVTGIHPYFGYELSNRTSLWGIVGYGQGDVDTTDRGETTSADMNMLIVAGGSSGNLGSPGIVGKTGSLSLNSDVLWVSLDSATEDAEVIQLRVATEASWLKTTANGSEIKRSAEVGVRLDGGDAETGLGIDIGLGLEWSDPASGTSTRLRGRGLLVHADNSLREQGVSGSFGWDSRPGSAEGMNLTMSYTVGDSATGGTQALFSRDTLSAFETNDDDLDNHRMEFRLGYGMPVLGSRFVGTPQTAFGYSDDERDVSIGWQMKLVDRSSVHGTGSLGLSVEARRSESASDGYRPEDEIVFRLRTQF